MRRSVAQLKTRTRTRTRTGSKPPYCHSSYIDCEIRHETLLVWTLGAHLVHFIVFFLLEVS